MQSQKFHCEISLEGTASSKKIADIII